MKDVARADDVADQPAQPDHHGLFSQHGRQLSGGFHTVLHGHHKCVGADHWAHGLGRVYHLPSLNPQDDRIDDPSLGGVVGGHRRGRHEIALDAIDPESMLPDGGQVFTASDKHHFLSCLGQPPAQITADASGAEYRYPQSNFSPELVDPGSSQPSSSLRSGPARSNKRRQIRRLLSSRNMQTLML